MKSIKIKNEIVIVGILTFLLIIPLIRSSYAVDTSKTFTRQEMQDMVVATSLSYYYNNLYSDYSQYLKDKGYGYSKTLVGGTYAWRSTAHAPEDVNRTNRYFIDCSSFAYIVYKNALGYDFSNHYQNARYSYFKQGKKYGYYNMTTSNINTYKDIFYTTKQNQSLFQEMVTKTGLEPDGMYYANISKKIKDKNTNANNISSKTGAYLNNSTTNKTQAVYYFEATGTTVEDVRKEINGKSEVMLEELEQVLQPGDIITYSFRTKNDDGTVSGNSGHVMIYVGGAINPNEKGIIHSSGYDYTYNDDGTMKSPGNDTYSVRYDLIDKRLPLYILTETDTKIAYKVSVERPINEFCDGNNCTIPTGTSSLAKAVDTNLLDNAIARSELSRLKLEQYAEIDKEYNNSENLSNTIGKYNSVNIGDTITYNLRIQNKANYSYCDRGTYYTKSGCENVGYEWKYSKTSDTYKYQNLKITAKIPTNTSYVPGSCTNNCIYDQNTKTLTWNVSELEPNSTSTTNVYSASNPTYIYSYEVTPTGSGKIVNEGMKITTSNNNTLQMGEMTTLVNPTINGTNIDLLKNEVDKFIKKFEEGKIVHNGVYITNNYKKDLDTLTTKITLAEGEFIKMIYYNALGIDIGYLRAGGSSTGDMITALFNKKSVKALTETKTIYYKKTASEISNLTGNQKLINNMLVPGLYGGRILRGNDNGDRESLLRVRNNNFSAGPGMNDLEFGDIVFYLSDNLTKVTTFMYYGQDSTGYPIFIKFTKNGIETYDKNATSGKTGFQKYANIYSRDLFWVLRPTKAYGTTIKYDYNGGTGKDINYVAYNTYRNLDTPTKEGYKVTFDYQDEENFENQEVISKNTFAGWYLDKNYATKITNNTTLKTTTAHTIYAKWTASSITLPNPKKEGYYFEGWYNGTTKVGEGGESYTPNKDIVLTPSFIELPKVSLELNIKDNNTINVKVTKTTGVLTGYEIYKYNNSSKDYNLVKDTTDLNTTITHNFKDNSKTKIYVKPYVKIEGEKIYGENSIEKEIEQEIEEPEDEKEEIILTKPTGLKASSLDYRSLYISWNKVNGADGYQIYKKSNTSNNYVSLGHITKNYVTARNGVITGKTVYYKIRAYKIVENKKEYGPLSNVVSGKAMLNIPSNGKGSSTGYKSGYLSYSKVSGATGYQIYKLSSITGKYYSLGYTKNNYAYARTGLTTGKTAYYKIRAYRVVSGKKVYGPFSKVISFKPIPSTPKNVRADKYRSGVAKIKWSKVNGATGYNIYKYNSTTKKYYYVKSTRSLSTTTSYGLRKGTSTYYKVKAYRIVNGKKIFSNYSASDYVKV